MRRIDRRCRSAWLWIALAFAFTGCSGTNPPETGPEPGSPDAATPPPHDASEPPDAAPTDAPEVDAAASAPDATPDASVDAGTDAPPDAGPPPPLGARQHCSADGWCWDRPLTGNSLHAIWGASARDVWAVGDAGVILHYDGVEWRVVPSPVTTALNAVSGSAADDVWAVGNGGVILHYDGVSWRRRISGTDVDFSGVSIRDRNLGWAVSPQQGIFAWNGTRWTPVRDQHGLLTVSGAAANDVWSLGRTSLGAFVLHHDGRDWRSRNLPDYRHVPVGLAALPDGEAWSVGYFRIDFAPTPGEAIHLFANSSRLFTVDSERALYDVFARAADDVWAVGERGLVAHWDGFQWTKPAVPITTTLSGVWAAAADDVWAVGSRGMLLHYDGRHWSTVDQPMLTGADEVFALSATDVIARAGDRLWRRGAGGWQEMSRPDGTLRALWARGRDDVFVVTSTGLHHFDGNRWTLERATTSGRGVWATAGDVWVADWYAVDHRAGTGDFSRLPQPGNPSGVGWARGRDDVYVATRDGNGKYSSRLLRFDGTRWTSLHDSSGSNDVTAIAGTATELAAIRTDGLYIHAGGAWSERLGQRCSGLAVDASGEIDASCAGGIRHRGAGGWTTQSIPTAGGISRISVADGWAWAVSSDAILYRAPSSRRMSR